MATFLEDPRLRQRWNQISHNAEGVAENAAAGIWTFQHRYIGPCLESICNSLDSCTAVCLGGDREERARRVRERERGARRARAEYSFDFYDDWDDDDDALAGYGYGSYAGFGAGRDHDGIGGAGEIEGGGGGGGSSGRGFFGRWAGGGRAEDWDRLLAGTSAVGGSGAGAGADVQTDQPRRKRTMSYGTRGAAARRKASGQEDPTIIPSTSSFGFLGRLPFKIGGTLRYKPSAANLQDHPVARAGQNPAEQGDGQPPRGDEEEAADAEREPLLGSDDSDDELYGTADGEGHAGQSEVLFSHDQLKMQPQDHRHHHHHRRQPMGHRQHHSLAEVEASAIYNPKTRKRSSTTGSGATSDSYRSRGDLFPSDGEGDEDAVPLDDEFAVALAGRVGAAIGDDRSSGATGSSHSKKGGGGGGGARRGSKGKRPAQLDSAAGAAGGGSSRAMSRSVSRTTMASTASSSNFAASLSASVSSLKKRPSSGSIAVASPLPQQQPPLIEEQLLQEDDDTGVGLGGAAAAEQQQGHKQNHDVPPPQPQQQQQQQRPRPVPSLEDLRLEEELAQQQEDEEVERKRRAAAQLAVEPGLHQPSQPQSSSHLQQQQPQAEVSFDDIPEPTSPTVALASAADIAAEASGEEVEEEEEEDLAVVPEDEEQQQQQLQSHQHSSSSPPPPPARPPQPPKNEEEDDNGGEGGGGGGGGGTFFPAKLPRFR